MELENRRKGKSSCSSIQQFQQFKCYANTLFDIAWCRCIEFETCNCEEHDKVPELMYKFLRDQRSDRKLRNETNLYSQSNFDENSPIENSKTDSERSNYSAQPEVSSS